MFTDNDWNETPWGLLGLVYPLVPVRRDPDMTVFVSHLTAFFFWAQSQDGTTSAEYLGFWGREGGREGGVTVEQFNWKWWRIFFFFNLVNSVRVCVCSLSGIICQTGTECLTSPVQRTSWSRRPLPVCICVCARVCTCTHMLRCVRARLWKKMLPHTLPLHKPLSDLFLTNVKHVPTDTHDATHTWKVKDGGPKVFLKSCTAVYFSFTRSTPLTLKDKKKKNTLLDDANSTFRLREDIFESFESFETVQFNDSFTFTQIYTLIMITAFVHVCVFCLYLSRISRVEEFFFTPTWLLQQANRPHRMNHWFAKRDRTESWPWCKSFQLNMASFLNDKHW